MLYPTLYFTKTWEIGLALVENGHGEFVCLNIGTTVDTAIILGGTIGGLKMIKSYSEFIRVFYLRGKYV